jgi:SecY interacting protein Syd
VDKETAAALKAFTARYCDAWHEQKGTWPQSEALSGIPSPCIITASSDSVIWQPQPFTAEQNVKPIERAMNIVVQPAVIAFYTTQFAGDMCARFENETLMLLQTWSEDDFLRVQENLIGHLVTQKRLKLSPTFFIATLDSELDIISVCNLTGEVLKETIGTRTRQVLSDSLADFLNLLHPVV